VSVKTPNLTTDQTAKYSFPVDEEPDWNEVQLRSIDGTRWGYRRASKKLRKWHFEFPLLTDTDFTSLMAFVDARAGGYERFYFDHPKTGEVDIPVQMVPKSFKTSWFAPNVRAAAFDVEEVAS
jgi:hypothetical protein